MINKSRKLISGLLSALLVGGGAFASTSSNSVDKVESESIVGKLIKGVVKLPFKVAYEVAKAPVKLAYGAASSVASAALGVVGITVAGYTFYLSYREYKAILDGTVGLYGFSEGDLVEMFKGAVGKYAPDKNNRGIFEHLRNSAKVVKAVASGLATRLRQNFGVDRVRGNVSLKDVICEYVSRNLLVENGGKVSYDFKGMSASEVVINAVKEYVDRDVRDSEKGVVETYGEWIKFFWEFVFCTLVSESDSQKMLGSFCLEMGKSAEWDSGMELSSGGNKYVG